MQPFTLFIYTFAPIESTMTCTFLFVAIVSTALYGLLLHNAITFVKYVFIFHLKNPTVIQDDFWGVFINIWIFIFCLVTQFSYLMMQGREHIGVYLCNGKFPLKYLNSPIKQNYIVRFIALFSLVIQIVFFGLRQSFKYRNNQKFKKVTKISIIKMSFLSNI